MSATVMLGWATLALLLALWWVADHHAIHSKNTYTLNRSRKWAVILKYAAAWVACYSVISTFGQWVWPGLRTTILIVIAAMLLGRLSDHAAFDDELYREQTIKN